MKINNKGYSLVEVIIVIAITAIFAGMSFVSLSLLTGAHTKKAAGELNSQLEVIRNETIAQEKNLAVKLVLDADGSYYLVKGTYDEATSVFTEGSQTKTLIGKSEKVKIFYNDIEVTTTSSVIIRFKKSDGSVLDGSGNYKIMRASNSGVPYTVVLNKNTGSHYVE